MEYNEFLQKKWKSVKSSGINVGESDLNTLMFPFQKFVTKKALAKGRYAIFADCGLGKTLMQLEWARIVSEKTNGNVLILAPLAVKYQTIEQGKFFGIDVSESPSAKVRISNYEQIDNIDTGEYSGVVLDESSILKNFTGVYRNKIQERFENTRYKLCCTATPSPNDLNEIGNHSEFLGILDNEDMRTKWFVRDEGMNNYRLKGHAEHSFYAWISSWAIMFSKPQDIGFEMDGYELPPLNIKNEIIQTEKKDNGSLFNFSSVNATEFQQALRETMGTRLTRAAEIANETKEQCIVWVKQNEEADALLKIIPDAKEVRGSDSVEKKEKLLLGFAKNEFRVLITKSKIAQFGLNYQNCHIQIFAAIDFSFESLYQSIRRSYRFGQKHAVQIYVLTTDTMENVIRSVQIKQSNFDRMKEMMNKNEQSESHGLLSEYEYREVKTDKYFLMNGDTCIEIKKIPDNSIDLIIFSPPFSSLFTYSNYIHDMGNNDNHEEFFKQYSYLLNDLYRILKPGRLMCTHTKDLAVYKNSSGYSGLYDFTGDHHRHVEAAGFKYHSKVCIWTDPVLEMQRTKTQRLLYKQVTQDSSSSGIGMPEYVTIFKKWEGSQEEWNPINSLNKSNFSLDTWQKWASPVWMDILRTDVLNGREGRDTGDEKHIAPLQLEVIKRLVYLYSNEGETVFTPFLGIGSEAYVAVKNKRKAIGCELKPSYFDVAVENLRYADEQSRQTSLFDIE